MPTYTVVLIKKTLTVTAENADSAINQVLGEDMPIDALVGAYTDTLTPHVNTQYGAPMGRMSGPMDHDGTHKATRLTLDDGGYDAAINQVLGEDMPIDALVGAYTDTLTPHVNAQYGAPMGRMSGPMDHDGTHKATRLTLDDGGYDAGGAYWGLRTAPNSLYAVEDGVGNIAYVDATTQDEAIQAALAQSL